MDVDVLRKFIEQMIDMECGNSSNGKILYKEKFLCRGIIALREHHYYYENAYRGSDVPKIKGFITRTHGQDFPVKIINEFIKSQEGRPAVERYSTEELGNLVIVGDICGDLGALLRIIYLNGIDANYLFLGNYIGRGPRSFICVLVVYSLMLINRRNIILRGSHEVRNDIIPIKPDVFRWPLMITERTNPEDMMSNFFFERKHDDPLLFDISSMLDPRKTLEGEELEKAKAFYKSVEDLVWKSFDYMSVCAIVDKTYFCSHGGISINLDFLKALDAIKKPFPIDEDIDYYQNQIMTKGDGIRDESAVDIVTEDALQIMWNEPTELENPTSSIIVNENREFGFYYTNEQLDTFLKTNEFTLVIHSHHRVQGCEFNTSRTDLTVNSQSTHYKHEECFMHIDWESYTGNPDDPNHQDKAFVVVSNDGSLNTVVFARPAQNEDQDKPFEMRINCLR